MGQLVVLNASGDETLEWDPADKDSVKKAKAEYDRLKKDGFEFFTVEQTKGKKITRFDKKLGRVIAAPGGRTESNKRTGARPRAMSGGPTLRAE